MKYGFEIRICHNWFGMLPTKPETILVAEYKPPLQHRPASRTLTGYIVRLLQQFKAYICQVI